MNKNKGFTIIELLLALGMYTLVVLLIISFFMANIKYYKIINYEGELQFQAQYIFNFMANKILESSYVELAKNGTIQYIYATGELPVTKISFRYGEPFECYIFEIRNDKIFYGNGYASASASVELGVYTREMKITPLPLGSNFREAKAVKINLLLSRSNQEYQAEQIICMRNNSLN